MNSNKLKKIIDSSASRCKKFRKRILDISQTVTALHAAGAFSSMEIVDILYNSIMKKGDTFRMNVADKLCVGNRGR